MQEEIIMLRAEVSDLKHLLHLPKVLENVNEADTPAGAAGAGGKNVVQAVVATSSFGGQAVAVTNILVEGLSVPPVAAGLAFPILQMPKVLEEVNEAAKPTGAAGAGGKKVVQAVVATSSIGGQAVAATTILGEGLSVPPLAAGRAFKAKAEAALQAAVLLAENNKKSVSMEGSVKKSAALHAAPVGAPTGLESQRRAMVVVTAAARRLPEIKVKFKALMKLAGGACIMAEVKALFSSSLLASDEDDDVLDLVVDWSKAVEAFSARELNGHMLSSDEKVAVLWDCFSSVL
jgi:hypothetical protein